MREDFFYRIHIIPIHLPPLRERKEDIPLLIEHFMQNYPPPSKNLPKITIRVMEALTSYDWPGNVRELINTMHRYLTLFILHQGVDITFYCVIITASLSWFYERRGFPID